MQEDVIPSILKKQDVLGVAQTGSGKTMSYVLPILQLTQNLALNRNRFIQVLVLVPTRKLAVQVNDVFQLFSSNLPQRIKTMAVFGGVSINPQMMKMKGVDILVATLGRLLDLISSNAVHLSDVKILVLDEADKMLNLGFEEEMTNILKLLPTQLQNLLFSATLAKEIDQITQMILHNPLKIEIETEPQDLDLINQIAYYVEDEQKGPLLRYLIKTEEMTQVLVFVASSRRADGVVSK
ncbi:MAG: DEAD/DEAH box helicase [Bacteroidales bacterium]|nr:DEAD/DEAH box helicase [Bacteroidales bacterium]MDY0216340.1 DEAD/DEAH box helicase [Bacteroidales bacterium]